MAIRTLTNAAYLATDWKDEAESNNLKKKGHIKIAVSASGGFVFIRAGSSVEVNGVVYVFDTDHTTTVPDPTIAQVPLYLLFDGTNFTTVSYTPSAPASFDGIKGGFYSGSSRIIAMCYDANDWAFSSLTGIVLPRLHVGLLTSNTIFAGDNTAGGTYSAMTSTSITASNYVGTGVSTTNTANTVVKRDASGNISAGAITGTTLTGTTSISSPSITGTTSISSPSYIGTGVDTANTANTVVKRNISGDIYAHSFIGRHTFDNEIDLGINTGTSVTELPSTNNILYKTVYFGRAGGSTWTRNFYAPASKDVNVYDIYAAQGATTSLTLAPTTTARSYNSTFRYQPGALVYSLVVPANNYFRIEFTHISQTL